MDSLYRKSEFNEKLAAYDGMASMYTLGPLPKEQYSLKVSIPGRRPDEMRDFLFKIKRVSSVNMELVKQFVDGKLDYTPHAVITALEVIMRHPMCMNNVVVGRSIFNGKNVEPISGAVDIWKGFFLSLRPGLGRLLLNADISATTFIAPGDVILIVRDFLGIPKSEILNTLNPRERGPLEYFLRSCRVEATHRGENRRRYKVLGLSSQGANATFFEDQDGKKMSVADYFKDTYKIQLEFPKLPCLVVGSSQKAVFLPMECCRIPPGQRYLRKLDSVQTSDMIKIANRKPSERLAGIRGALAILDEQQAYLKGFRFGFGRDLVNVNGRVLAPPVIYYGKESRESDIIPGMGAWNLKDKRVEIPATLSVWSVLVFGRAPENEVQAFVREFVTTSIDTGMFVTQKQPPIIFATPNVEQSVRKAYEEAGRAAHGQKPQIVLCILPTDDAGLYGDIKRVTDTQLGLPSQCMLMKHIRRPSKQYCANLVLKVNVKLGGVNSSLGRSQSIKFITERPTMVLGADVTHPGIGEADKPSIAAVVGSMDIKLSRYATSVRVQGSRVEIIDDLRAMFREQVQHFVAANRTRPQRILFYRDGVSEGQFGQVLDFELTAIKAACKEMDPKYDPKITFILVQKRHHTRFFAAEQRDTDRSGNVPAGTVVDTGVVHPNQFDFFLCSHGGLQGTSRPAHYHVVHDENKFEADELQLLSYHLCYTFARCTRSVSIVTPAYYAHLVAFRARFHFEGVSGQGIFHDVKPELAPNMYFI
jgi:eukaryotic translation initiation factor 2C